MFLLFINFIPELTGLPLSFPMALWVSSWQLSGILCQIPVFSGFSFWRIFISFLWHSLPAVLQGAWWECFSSCALEIVNTSWFWFTRPEVSSLSLLSVRWHYSLTCKVHLSVLPLVIFGSPRFPPSAASVRGVAPQPRGRSPSLWWWCALRCRCCWRHCLGTGVVGPWSRAGSPEPQALLSQERGGWTRAGVTGPSLTSLVLQGLRALLPWREVRGLELWRLCD